MGIIGVSLAWVLWRRNRIGHYQVLISQPILTGLVAMFSFAQAEGQNMAMQISAYILVFASWGSLLISEHRQNRLRLCLFKPRSITDRLVYAGVGLFLVSYLLVKVFIGEYFEDVGSIDYWVRLLNLVSLLLIYLVATRGLVEVTERVELLRIASVVFIIVFIIGAGRMADAFYNLHRAENALLQREYSRLASRVDLVLEQNQTLEMEGLRLDFLLQRFANLESANLKLAEGYTALGDIAQRFNHYAQAIQMYRQAQTADAEYEDKDIYWKLGDSLFAYGKYEESMLSYQQGVEAGGDITRSALGLGVLLTKKRTHGEADMRRAASIFERGLRGVVRESLDTAEAEHLFVIEDLLGELATSYLQELTPYEIVQLLIHYNIPVIYESMSIGTTGLSTPVDIVAISTGGGFWTQERIEIDGVDESPLLEDTISGHRRGYNLVVIDPETGLVEDRRNFDIWGNRHIAPDQLVEWVNAVPKGRIVVGTVRGDAGMFFNERMRRVFRKLGVPNRPDFNWSHAFIGVKGAPPGSALEAISQDSHVAVGVLDNDNPLSRSTVAREEAMRALLKDNLSAPAVVFLEHDLAESVVIVRNRF